VNDQAVNALAEPMRRALELAWESTSAGSLGIGAVVVDADGDIIATGRNRLFEHDPGDDHLAGTSLAHAELNALAKLRWGLHRDAGLTLFTTLQPCLQCLGAIWLSQVSKVIVLAPDPLFRGVESILDVNEFVAARRLPVTMRPVDEWSVLGLLLPSHAYAFWSADLGWAEAAPQLARVAEDLVATRVVLDLASAGASFDQLVAAVAPHLPECVAEVASLMATSDDGVGGS
jgi:tRNA(Arg) A34 adenosine deaminase TadA